MARSAARVATLAALVLALVALRAPRVLAHAGPRLTDPIAGATLGDSPTAITLSFSERPEPSLCEIRVTDTAGATYQTGRAELLSGDPLSLAVRVRRLDRGVYFVNWRVVSAVDGHSTDGVYAFGVRADPAKAAASLPRSASLSALELAARWTFILGIVVLLGASCATAARFGGPRDLALASLGCGVAAVGLALLVLAQQRAAAAPIWTLAKTPIGRALVARALALAAAAGALVAARAAGAARSRVSMAGAAVAAAAAAAAHVGAGHAAADAQGMPLISLASQWLHFVAAGVWFGGLAALVAAVGGSPPPQRLDAIRRFSNVAAACLFVVAATGVLRTLAEIATWEELVSTGYGAAVIAKIALVAAIAALGAVNRWRAVPAARTTVAPLRRIASGELTLAAAAFGAAALLGTLPPPAAARIPFMSATGVDFATTVRVRLVTASDQPGPNRFGVRVVDYDTGQPARARRVTLRFTPLDDPAPTTTSLALSAEGDEDVGSGPNIAFEGRWRVTALVERDQSSVEVPLDVETRALPQFVSIARHPGDPTIFTVEPTRNMRVRFLLAAERPGPQPLSVFFFDGIISPWPVDAVVVTAAARGGQARQLAVHRVDSNAFETVVDFVAGVNRLSAVGRMADGTRVRAWADINISAK